MAVHESPERLELLKAKLQSLNWELACADNIESISTWLIYTNDSSLIHTLYIGSNVLALVEDFIDSEWKQRYLEKERIVPKNVICWITKRESLTQFLLLRKLLKSWHISFVKHEDGHDHFIADPYLPLT